MVNQAFLFLFMKNSTFCECVANCKANGQLTLEKHYADAFIESHRDFILGIDGTKRYYEFLALGAFCEEIRCDREAMSAYLEVFDNIMWDKSLRLATGKRHHLKMLAVNGLLRLASSPEEVVWEICSQVTEGY